MKREKVNIVASAEGFISKYATLADEVYLLPLALWAIATHCWPIFDTFPYLVITGYTKRCGKTRLMELMAAISANGRTYSPDSPSAMFRAVSELKPSMFLDEAEKLNREDHPAREMLNKGYRKGQTITRVVGGKPYDFECYCPKCFVLIGDVYDTLRDRSIVVVMRRRTPIEAASETKFRMDAVKTEAEIIRGTIANEVAHEMGELEVNYSDGFTLDFLNDRDEEIWQSLFTICKTFAPDRIEELTRCAVDMSTEKQAPSRKSSGTDWMRAEETADMDEAKVFLLKDMLILSRGKTHITTSQLLDALKDIPTSQWRKYKGQGLTAQQMAELLDSLSIHPKNIRIKKRLLKQPGSVVKGYKRDDLLAAAQLLGLEGK